MREQLVRDLASVINRHSLENGSDTPDFLLAEYLVDCLEAHERVTGKTKRLAASGDQQAVGGRRSADGVDCLDESLPGFADLLRRVRAGLTTFEEGAVELDALCEAEHRRVMDQINAGLRQIAAVMDQHGIQWRTRKDAGNSMAAEPSLSTALRELDDMAASNDVDRNCREVAQVAAGTLRHLERTLRRLADASEAAAPSDPDMPSHEITVAVFDAALDAAREVLQS